MLTLDTSVLFRSLILIYLFAYNPLVYADCSLSTAAFSLIIYLRCRVWKHNLAQSLKERILDNQHIRDSDCNEKAERLIAILDKLGPSPPAVC